MLTPGGFAASMEQVIRKGFVDAAKGLIKDGYPLELEIRERALGKLYARTALHMAAGVGEVEICKALLEAGAKIDSLNHDRRTPLHCAVNSLSGNENGIGVCELLLSRGANPNAADKSGLTPLHEAATVAAYVVRNNAMSSHQAHLLDVVRTMISRGANPDFMPSDANNRYRTPFQVAVKENAVELVKLFIDECGVDWTQKTLSGKTMHQIATEPEMKALLLSCRTAQKVVSALPQDSAGEDDAVFRAKCAGMAPL